MPKGTPLSPMRLTSRDLSVLRDIGLSHVLSRDQIIRLGYFGSVTRTNSRLRGLTSLGLLKRVPTPFFSQSLYVTTKRASHVVGDMVGPLIEGRTGSPRFLQHALLVTETRLALLKRGATQWRFEAQLWASVSRAGQVQQVRPDGMAFFSDKGALAVEVDLGHVNPKKFGEKLRLLDHFVASGEAKRTWGTDDVRLLTLTTGAVRARHLARLTPSDCSFIHAVDTFAAFDLPLVGSWS